MERSIHAGHRTSSMNPSSAYILSMTEARVRRRKRGGENEIRVRTLMEVAFHQLSDG